MKRLALAVVAVVGVSALAGAVQHARHRGGPCDQLTPAALLQDPELARQYLAGQGPAVDGELDALVSELRAVHGCGDASLASPHRPFAHPAPGTPRLPPGHPPVGGSPALPDLGGGAQQRVFDI